MKNVSRNKFLLCFRPVVDMDLVLGAEGGIGCSRKSQALKYIGTTENKYSISENDRCLKDSENSIIVRHPSQRTFSKAKRGRDRKNLSEDSHQSKRSFSRKKSLDSRDDKSLNNASDNTDNLQVQIKSNPVLSSQSLVSASSTCSTSSTSEPKTKNQNHNHQESIVKRTQMDRTDGSSSFNYAISLLLLSLTVTILWGRLCAILFTSISLYFLPYQQSGSRSEYAKKRTKKDHSRDYKKRIIMEGLLERNHHKEVALNF